MIKTFTATDLQRKTADVFNSVQANGKAYVKNKSRPQMVLILEDQLDGLLWEITGLKGDIEALKGKVDNNLQQDLLKG